MGTYHHRARPHCPSAGQVWPGRIPSLSSLCHPKLPQAGDSFKRLRSHSPSPSAPRSLLCRDPSIQRVSREPGTSLAGAATAEGEGQTGEAGTGTMSPLVNSAGPCSLFRALNRGWCPSSAELGAGGYWSWFNTPRHGWKDGGAGRATPDGNMWGVSPVATCPSSPSHLPFI